MSLYHQTLANLEHKEQQFVLIGAMDGVAHDELYPYAQKNKHWSGLLVEPVKSYFEELKKNYAYRENLIFENVAITKEIGHQDIYTVDRSSIEQGQVPFWCNGISTFNPNGPTIARHDIKDKVHTVKVTCCRFEDLVHKHNLKRIDILQIDAEGCDYEIFTQVWNLGFRPHLIYIEVVHMTADEVKSLTSLLQTNGYHTEQNGDNVAAVKTQTLSHTKKKRIAFYTYPLWALGSLHTALCKELYPYGIDADLLDWTQKYTLEEWQDFKSLYDLIVTTSGEGVHVLTTVFQVPYEKIIFIAHGQKDFEEAVHRNINFNALRKIGVVAKSLETYAKSLGITKDITVLNGIHFDRFYQAPASRLTKIGYAGALQHLNLSGSDCKRSHLVQQLGSATGLPVVVAGQRSYLRMPQFYKDVDCVVVSSTEIKSCALPLMESAAAGRLPISAKIGIASEFENPMGIILPLEDTEFVRVGSEKLKELKDNSQEFYHLCQDAQEFAYQEYDWPKVIQKWVDIFA